MIGDECSKQIGKLEPIKIIMGTTVDTTVNSD